MNDPNHTPDDLLEDLEEEFLALAEAGDYKAMHYALAESDEVNAEVIPALMGLMRLGAMRSDPLFEAMAAVWVKRAVDELLEVIAEHVAPLWAGREAARRVKAAADMVAEWAEEAAA